MTIETVFELNALKSRIRSSLLVEMTQYKDITEVIKSGENKDDIIECQQYIIQCMFDKLEKEGITL